jgi:hypothetical protein
MKERLPIQTASEKYGMRNNDARLTASPSSAPAVGWQYVTDFEGQRQAANENNTESKAAVQNAVVI